MCILSGDMWPSATHVRVVVRKGTLSISHVHFRDNVGDLPPPGVVHEDCVTSGSQSTLSDQRIKTNASAVDSGLLLDFCNSLSPQMYARIDRGPEVRMGLMAQDVQASLQTHSLPQAPFIGTRYEAIHPNTEIEEWMSLDYSRLTVALLGAVKELTNRITQQ